MRVFLTGASGYTGDRALHALLNAGHDVVALVRSPQHDDTLAAAGARIVRGSLEEADEWADELAGCDAVVHVAAMFQHFGRYDDFYRANVRGTEVLLAVAERAHIKRFVYLSAAGVIMGAPRPIHGADETWPLQQPAFSPYIATKSLAEKCVLAANAPNFATIALRPALIWGAGRRDHLLDTLRSTVRGGQWVWLDGGNYPMMTTHVENVCEAILLALESDRCGEAYFIFDGSAIPFRSVFEGLARAARVTLPDRRVPFGVAWTMASVLEGVWRVTNRAGAPPITRSMLRLAGQPFDVSDARARAQLGYVARMTVAAGMDELSALMARRLSISSS